MDLTPLIVYGFIVWSIGVICGGVAVFLACFWWALKAMDPHDGNDQAADRP